MSVADVVSQMGLLPPIYDPNTYSDKLSPFKDFYPPDSLFHSYLWWASTVAYSTPLYHIGVLLPIVCHEATRRGFKLEKSGEIPRIWTCLLGGSGSGKSTCHKMGRKFYDEYRQKTGGTSYKPPFCALKGTKEGVKHALVADYLDGATGRVLAILENDEVTSFLPRGGKSVSEDLCQMFDGEPTIDHTRTAQREALAGSPQKSLKDYTVQGLFATTPAALDEATDEGYFTGGLFPRILWISGKKPEKWHPGLLDWKDTQRATVLARWEDWGQWVDTYQQLGGARIIRYTPEALQVYDAFWQRNEHLCFDDEGGRLPPMYLRGVTDHAWKIAAAFAFSSEEAFDTKGGTGVYVGDLDMEAAVHVIEGCFVAFTKIAVTVSVPLSSKIEDRILSLLKAAGSKGVSKKDLMLEFASQRLGAQQALAILLAASQVDSMTPRARGTAKNPPGKPSTYYYLTSLGETVREAIQARWEKEKGVSYKEETVVHVGTVATSEPVTPQRSSEVHLTPQMTLSIE